MPDLTEAELFKAIGEATADQEEGGFHTQEVADMLGLHKRYALERIKKLVEAGLAEPCRVRREDIHGRQCTYFGYRLVDNGDG